MVDLQLFPNLIAVAICFYDVGNSFLSGLAVIVAEGKPTIGCLN